MEEWINVKGIDRAKLLAALYNGTQCLGMGILHDLGRDMTTEEAESILARYDGRGRHSFDFYYVHGRPIKIWIEYDEIKRPDLYDRDSHKSCKEIVSALRAESCPT